MIHLRSRLIRAAATFVALVATSGLGTLVTAASASAQAAATETQSVHDDWTVRCKPAEAGRECEATQTLQTPDLKGVLAHVAVRAQKGGPVYLVVLVPPGVWLPANVTLKVAGIPDLVMTYRRCGQHCVAALELTEKDLAALKASAGVGDLVFENGSRQSVILPLSFKGLGKAMQDSLNN